jgi:flagellar motor protein MotB
LNKKIIFALEGFYAILMSSFILILNKDNNESNIEELEISKKDSFETVEEINLDIDKEFQANMGAWGAKFEKSSLTMTFNGDSADNPIVMFDNGSDLPTKRYRDIIEDFCPRYFNKIKPYLGRNSISEIEINGHTSSEWFSVTDQYTSYMENMILSQRRSQNVFNICIFSINNSEYAKDKELLWLFIKKTSANGKSWSNIKYNDDGTENKEASRRVEFRIITSIESRVEELNSTSI